MSAEAADRASLEADAMREVHERHHAFVEWFCKGDDETVMASIIASFGADFAMIHPDGLLMERDVLIESLRKARCSREADFEIIIDDARPLWSRCDAVLVGYIERQSIGGERTARRSTALFTRQKDAPCGVVWRHLQETWLAAGGTR